MGVSLLSLWVRAELRALLSTGQNHPAGGGPIVLMQGEMRDQRKSQTAASERGSSQIIVHLWWRARLGFII